MSSLTKSSSSTKKRIRRIVIDSDDDSERDSIEDFVVDDDDGKGKKRARSDLAAPVKEVMKLHESEEEDVASEDFANEVDAELARWKAEREKKKCKKTDKGKEMPTSLQMARELGIRYIGGIDPGIVNAAFIVYDAYEARIVYWRLMRLDTIVQACASAQGLQLYKSGTKIRREALIAAIRWWCDNQHCPMNRADLVCIESQNFHEHYVGQDMIAVEASWYASLVSHSKAVNVPILGAENGERLIVPKPYNVESNSVKLSFGSTWFPTTTGSNRNASNANSSSNNNYHKRSGNYSLNKKNVSNWAKLIATSKAAHDDFEKIAVHGKWMTEGQVEETMEVLRSGKKADDLGDALFIALYAADCLIPSLWKRVNYPKRYKNAYLINEPPQQMSATNRKRVLNGDAEMSRRIVEGHHQSLMSYVMNTSRLPQSKIDTILSTLNR